MAYIITDTCTKDELCVEACPTDCIHPKKDEEVRGRDPALCGSRRMHRLWGVRSGVSDQFGFHGG